MRTTLKLDPDVWAEVVRLREEEGLGIGEAVNLLARLGLTVPRERPKKVYRPFQEPVNRFWDKEDADEQLPKP